MKISFFDFDGTITKKDSLFHFVKYSVGSFKYYFGLFILSPNLILFKLNLIPNHVAKQKLISYYFKGWNSISFIEIAHKYSIEEIDKIVRPVALEKLKWHIKNHKL